MPTIELTQDELGAKILELQGWELDFEDGVLYGASHKDEGWRRFDELPDPTRDIGAAWQLWASIEEETSVQFAPFYPEGTRLWLRIGRIRSKSTSTAYAIDVLPRAALMMCLLYYCWKTGTRVVLKEMMT